MRLPALVLLAFSAVACAGFAQDWPTYRADAQRSGVYSGALDVGSLELSWVYDTPCPLQPAWTGPEPRDAYNHPNVLNEDPLDIDTVLHVAAVGESVFLGSSGEDALKCLDAATGEVSWAFIANGPVRFAPHVVDGRVYLGADDGWVYCVASDSGEMIWKYRAAPTGYRVPSNGKLISVWPNRTGVVVEDGILYCGAGMFPSEGVYVCAVDAETGEELVKERFEDMSLQGYVLASQSHVIMPGGRSGPWVFDRESGERKGQFGGPGGAFALVTKDDTIISGPGRTSAQAAEMSGSTGDSLATYRGAKQLVVREGMAYIATTDSLSALARDRYLALGKDLAEASAKRGETETGSAEYDALTKLMESVQAERDQCERWSIPVELPRALIYADGHIVVGLDDGVAAYRADDGSLAWQASVEGSAKGLAAAQGRLLVSTDEGRIYCFSK